MLLCFGWKAHPHLIILIIGAVDDLIHERLDRHDATAVHATAAPPKGLPGLLGSLHCLGPCLGLAGLLAVASPRALNASRPGRQRRWRSLQTAP